MRILRSTIAASASLISLFFGVGSAWACHKPPHACAFQHDTEVAVSWSDLNYFGSRNADARIKSIVERSGGRYISVDAQGSADKQSIDVENLVDQGAKVLIIQPLNVDIVLPAVKQALQSGLIVISYGTPIPDQRVFYAGFDHEFGGRLEAQALLKAVPQGNYVLFDAPNHDQNSKDILQGQLAALNSKISSGDITIVANLTEDNWRSKLDTLARSNNKKIDAVLAPNDEVSRSLAAINNGWNSNVQPAISGQNSGPDAFKRIAEGTQIVSIWQDPQDLADAAIYLALGVATGDNDEDFQETKLSTGETIPSVLIPPLAITRDNLSIAIEKGGISKRELCSVNTNQPLAACQ